MPVENNNMTNSEMECKKYVLNHHWVGNPSFYFGRGQGSVFGRLKGDTDLQRIHRPYSPTIQQVDGAEIGTWKFQYPTQWEFTNQVIFLFVFEIRIYNNSNNNDHET